MVLNPTKILTSTQLNFLDLLSRSSLSNEFYLSGGTALCGFYLPYRLSEDLDFFSVNEFDVGGILTWLKGVKLDLGYTDFDLQTSMNRNLIFLQFPFEVLKTEFTYYPFANNLENNYKNIKVDSLHDIALNKLFTIYQKPRMRDFMDLYEILQHTKFDFGKLRIDAKTKFDWDIELVQLGSQLTRCGELKDLPSLVRDFNYVQMQNFYLRLAEDLKSGILS